MNIPIGIGLLVLYTAPYGTCLSGPLEKGKTYYVEVGWSASWQDHDETMPYYYLEPLSGWMMKRKVTIK